MAYKRELPQEPKKVTAKELQFQSAQAAPIVTIADNQ